jgi:hypothetical protein
MAEKVCGAWRFPRHKIELFIVNLFRLALFELCSRLCQNNSLLYHETIFYWTHPEILLFEVQPKGDRSKVQKIRKEPSFKRKIDDFKRFIAKVEMRQIFQMVFCTNLTHD